MSMILVQGKDNNYLVIQSEIPVVDDDDGDDDDYDDDDDDDGDDDDDDYVD